MSDPSLIQRRPAARKFYLVCVCLIALPLLLVCGYWVWRAKGDRALDAQLAVLRERGEPVTISDMNAYAEVPGGVEDTTQAWNDAFGSLNGPPAPAIQRLRKLVPAFGGVSGAVWPSPSETWKELDEVEDLIDQFRDQIELAHATAAKPGAMRLCDDYKDGRGDTLASMMFMFDGSRLLRLQSRVHAHRNRSEEVARCLDTMIALGESIRREPSVLTQHFRTGMIGDAAKETCSALGCVDFNDQQLAGLQDAFSRRDFEEGARRAIIGERWVGIYVLRKGVPFEAEASVSMFSLQYLNQDAETYFSYCERMLNSLEMPYSERFKEMETIKQEVESLRGLGQTMAQMHVEALAPAMVTWDEGRAWGNMARTAIAAKRFQLKKGSFPDSIEECVPDFLRKVPLDPYTDEPILYVLSASRRSLDLSCTQPHIWAGRPQTEFSLTVELPPETSVDAKPSNETAPQHEGLD